MKNFWILIATLGILYIINTDAIPTSHRHRSRQGRCPAGQRMYYCFVWPCWGWRCNSDRNLTCVADYCGGCNRKWKNGSNQFVGCPGGEEVRRRAHGK